MAICRSCSYAAGVGSVTRCQLCPPSLVRSVRPSPIGIAQQGFCAHRTGRSAPAVQGVGEDDASVETHRPHERPVRAAVIRLVQPPDEDVIGRLPAVSAKPCRASRKLKYEFTHWWQPGKVTRRQLLPPSPVIEMPPKRRLPLTLRLPFNSALTQPCFASRKYTSTARGDHVLLTKTGRGNPPPAVPLLVVSHNASPLIAQPTPGAINAASPIDVFAAASASCCSRCFGVEDDGDAPGFAPVGELFPPPRSIP